MNAPQVPWIQPQAVVDTLDGTVRGVGQSIGYVTGFRGDGVVSIAGLPLRLLDIILLLGIAGATFVYFYWKDRIGDVENARKQRIADMYLRPSVVHIRNERWANIESLFRSSSPSDWRLAVIEADAMLDELILMLGYPGETMGERMQQLIPGNFPKINQAWEAHKFRNRIAHEGLRFQMSPQDASYIMNLYETVFRDAQYI